MVCRSWGIAALVIVAGVVGCVEVPDNIRAQFAGPGAQDRTNYRPGNHGAEPAPVAKAATTTTTSADASDAAAAPVDPAAPVESADAGAP
jgi:hypothetical protein